MLVTCSHCQKRHTLSNDAIAALDNSIMRCDGCGHRIKIAFCPKCKTSYAITFSSAKAARYSLTCRQCGNPFTIEFPLPAETARERPAPQEAQAREAPMPRRPLSGQPRRADRMPYPHETGRRRAADMLPNGTTLRQTLSICAGAFTPVRMLYAAAGVILASLLIGIVESAQSALHASTAPRESAFLSSLLSFLPVVLFLFSYLLAATPIARITIASALGRPHGTVREHAAFMTRGIMPIVLGSLCVLLIANTLLILFGKIPLIGPVFYSLLFLPIYLISLAFIVVGVVAFWFYPAVLAQAGGGLAGSATSFIGFVRRHNLNLLVIIPILGIASLLVFTFISLIHHGALSLALSLSSGVLQDDLSRTFTAIPFSLQKLVDFPVLISRMRLTQSFIGELMVSHRIGGVILGTSLAAIGLVIYSAMLSFVATASSYVYLVLERKEDVEDGKKIEVLAVIVLLLAALFLVKKVFF